MILCHWCTEYIKNCTIATYQIRIEDDNIANNSHKNDTIMVLSKLRFYHPLNSGKYATLVNFHSGTTAREDARADLVPRPPLIRTLINNAILTSY
jgi:hypothetical protein